MPITNGKDSHGPYYKYGEGGKKYYYTSNDKKSREKAKEKARKQGVAIEISRHRD